jgi:hypothetical protein
VELPQSECQGNGSRRFGARCQRLFLIQIEPSEGVIVTDQGALQPLIKAMKAFHRKTSCHPAEILSRRSSLGASKPRTGATAVRKLQKIPDYYFRINLDYNS